MHLNNCRIQVKCGHTYLKKYQKYQKYQNNVGDCLAKDINVKVAYESS
jgi:hypothetical protein